MARKDAAFQAYVALYNAGLLNDHLLPLFSGDQLIATEDMDDLYSVVEIQQRYNPWYDVAKKWSIRDELHWKRVNIRCADQVVVSMNLILPMYISSLPWSPLLSKEGVMYDISMDDSKSTETEICDLHILRNATRLILGSIRGISTENYPDDVLALFMLQGASQEIRAWIGNYPTNSAGRYKELKEYPLAQDESSMPSYPSRRGCHHQSDLDGIERVDELSIINRAKSIQISEEFKGSGKQDLRKCSTTPIVPDFLIREVEPDSIIQFHHDTEQFALYAPHVMHRLEILLVGNRMLEMFPPNMRFENTDLLVKAISSVPAQ